MQGNPQSVRYTVYQLIDALMTRARPALKRMGKEFISGYCALAEGEKDPRNLMLSFGMVYVILVEFEIDQNVEVSSGDRTSLRFDLTADRVRLSRRYRISLTSRSVTFR